MKNFIFKSSQDFGLIKNVFNKLEMLLSEQRKQRHDLSVLQTTINKLINDMNLQTQVNEYFDETSHQTESDDKRDLD